MYAFSTILGQAPANEADSDAWRQTRARNHAINLSLIEPACLGAIDYLVFSHDERVGRQSSRTSRSAIADAIGKAGATNRVVIQPGADHVAMLLLTRALAARFAYQPGVQAVYSSPTAREAAADGCRAGRHRRSADWPIVAACSCSSMPRATRARTRPTRLPRGWRRPSTAPAASWWPTSTSRATRLARGCRWSRGCARGNSCRAFTATPRRTALEDTLGTALAHGLLYARRRGQGRASLVGRRACASPRRR